MEETDKKEDTEKKSEKDKKDEPPKENDSGKKDASSKKPKKLKLYYALLSLLILALLVSLSAAARDITRYNRERAANSQITAMMHESEEALSAEETETEAQPAENSSAIIPEEPLLLPKYAELYSINSELSGWLTVDGLGIDLPVMYSPDEHNRYLHKNFFGEDTYSGTLYVGVPWYSDFAIIYGHNMRDGSMFGQLPQYAQESYGTENPVFRFDTLYETREYELVSAFFTQIYPADDTEHFHFYNYGGMLDRDFFENYVSQVKELALYDTGVTPEWGDTLLLLVTCSYQVEDGRFVVVARQVK